MGEREIEGRGVSPRLGDDEAEFGGTSHETQLRPLAPRLGVADVHPWIFHGIFAVLTWTTKNAAWAGRAVFTVYISILSSSRG
jgi:hypothetical protein